MNVEALLMQLSVESEVDCADSFQYFMAEVIERLYVINARVEDEVIKKQFDSNKIARDLFAHRNVVIDEIKIRERSPYYALTAYSLQLKLTDDEYLSALKYFSYVCARLSLRHHSRGRPALAAMYATETNLCTDVLCTYLPSDVEASKARSALAKYAANQRHIKTHAKQQEVVDYFLSNIYPTNPGISNEKAAEWLMDTFPDLSFRKLSEYVGDAKRKMKDLPSASKT